MKDEIISLVTKNFFKISFIILMLVLMFYILMPFIVSIILGGILAVAFAPFVEYFVAKGLKRSTALIIFTLSLGTVGLVPVVAFFIRGSRVISEQLHESNFTQFSQNLTTSGYRWMDQLASLYGLDNAFVKVKVTEVIVIIGTFLSTTINEFVTELPTILLFGMMTTLSVYFFLSQSHKIRALFDRYFYFNKKNGDNFVFMFKSCCREVFFANIVTGILQATIVSVGALIFGVGDFFLIFFMTFVFSFIPVIGAAPIAVILALVCFTEARTGSGIGMLVVAVVAGLSDNILRPLLGSLGKVEVHPFIGLMAVIGGVIMFGLPGLFIGPLVASLCFGALPIIMEEYFPAVPLSLDEDS